MKNIKENQSFVYSIAAASLLLLFLSFAYLPTNAMSYENVQSDDYDSISAITSSDIEEELTSTTLPSSMQQDFSDPMSTETTTPSPSITITPFQSTTTTTNQNTVNACSDIGANIYLQPSGTSSCPFPLTQIQLSVVKYNAIQCFFLPMGQFQIPLGCRMDNSASASTFGLSNPFSPSSSPSSSTSYNVSLEETFDYTAPHSPIPSLPNTITP